MRAGSIAVTIAWATSSKGDSNGSSSRKNRSLPPPGWLFTEALARGRENCALDERLLGSSDFVRHLIDDARRPTPAAAEHAAAVMPEIIRTVARHCELATAEIVGNGHRPAAVAARAIVSYLATNIRTIRSRVHVFSRALRMLNCPRRGREMPANLTPEYRAAEQQLMQAKTPAEKLEALRLMLSRMPKHKGTDKLQADIKRRIARLNNEIQSQAKHKGFAIHVEKEGAAQVVVIGPPNSGKSQLVSALTGVALEVAPYAFTTLRPAPAMMPYEDVQIQLVDLPAISAVHTESGVFGIIRSADAALLVVDLASPQLLEQIEEVLNMIERYKLQAVRDPAAADPSASIALKQCRLIGTKLDLPGAGDNVEALQAFYGARFGFTAVSGETGENVRQLRETIFRMLRLVRVYSKPPHEAADLKKPFVLREGSTLRDFANIVHHDFAERLKFARVWGHGKFEGQRINREYILRDRDVIELHL